MVRVVVTMVLVLALARPILAQEASEEIRKVEPVVVTATKIETSQAQLGAAVTVITDEEIRELNFNRLEEALRQVPGVEVQTSGSPGKSTSIRIRGSSPQQVLVLFDGLRIQSPTLGSTSLHVGSASLSTAAKAQTALAVFDKAIQQLSTARAKVGASQNRLQVTINNLASQTEALSAANSRIRDVDVASETAAMTRAQILSQAGVAVLAQANQMPSAALSLLR